MQPTVNSEAGVTNNAGGEKNYPPTTDPSFGWVSRPTTQTLHDPTLRLCARVPGGGKTTPLTGGDKGDGEKKTLSEIATITAGKIPKISEKSPEEILKSINLKSPDNVSGQTTVLSKGEMSEIRQTNSTPSTEISPKVVIDEIVRFAQLIRKDGYEEIRLKLKPEHLGFLKMRIIQEQGQISCHFSAQSQAVREILETNLHTLRQHLQNIGVKVDAFSITLSGGDLSFGETNEKEQEIIVKSISITSEDKEGIKGDDVSSAALPYFTSSRINYLA
ncbi:MAG: hypothetical protein DDT19_02624 [Syntrophomonadaceae bacterium]|nr:hypothetical protein [Bacillota bacterium]